MIGLAERWLEQDCADMGSDGLAGRDGSSFGRDAQITAVETAVYTFAQYASAFLR